MGDDRSVDDDTVTEANRSTIRAAFEAWQNGTAPITDVFAVNMTWRIAGRSTASRSYSDRQHFIDEVLAPFGARFAAGEPFRPVGIRRVLADGDAVAVIWDGRGVANDGVPYENGYAWIMTMSHGLVTDGVAFYDSIAFNELWERVSPRGD